MKSVILPKVTEENRSAIVKMGRSMMNATEFNDDSIGKAYKGLIKSDAAYGTYPVVLSACIHSILLQRFRRFISLYVNLMEVTASLVRNGRNRLYRSSKDYD